MEKRKRGRPAGDIIRNRNCRVSLSNDEFEHIDSLVRITGKTKSDIFREAFKMYENYQRSILPDEDEEIYEYDYEEGDFEEENDEEIW